MPRLRGEERNHTLGKARQHQKASRVHDWPSCFRLLHCLRVADCLKLGVYITGGYCWSTLRIVLDDLKSAKPHLCCRQSGSRLCEMPLMKAFYIFLLQEQFL
jgi:hypothetical protein